MRWSGGLVGKKLEEGGRGVKSPLNGGGGGEQDLTLYEKKKKTHGEKVGSN